MNETTKPNIVKRIPAIRIDICKTADGRGGVDFSMHPDVILHLDKEELFAVLEDTEKMAADLKTKVDLIQLGAAKKIAGFGGEE